MHRLASATIGITSAALGVAAGHAVAAWINPAASPVVAVGAVIIDLTPTPVKEWAVSAFGTADKLVLLIGVGVAVAGFAAVAGLLAARNRSWGVLATGLLGALAVAAAVTRPASGGLDGLPGVVAAAVGAAALVGQFRWVLRPSPDQGEGIDRRLLLGGTAGIALTSGLIGSLGQRAATPQAPPTPISLPPAAKPLPELPRGLEASVEGLSPLRTPTEDFYRIDIALAVPRIDPATWRLSIDGMVAAPFTLTFAELLAMPLIERDITLTCVSNEIGGPLCGSTRWRGVRVADLLRRAGPRPDADMVLSSSPDGFSAGTPLAVLLDGRDAMIAVAMDGEPLTAVHGAPARLLTPGLYGYVGGTKWVKQLMVTRFDAAQAYWTARGWAALGPVKTATRIDTPRRTIRSGDTVIAGVAWATHRGISRVQVRVDEEPWRDAVLSPDVGVDYWRQWYLPWQATTGTHRLTARAFDGSGEPQPAEVTPVFPDGPTGYHQVTLSVG